MNKSRILLFCVAVVALVAGIFLAKQASFNPELLKARYYEPARQLDSFELIDQHNKPFDRAALQGKWSLVFLGYTHCPDVCPMTLAKLANLDKKIKREGIDDIQIVFISVDPARDDAARLKEYTAYFNEEFIAATAEHKQLYPFVRNLGLMYAMVDDTEAGNEYAVDHSASISLLNPAGNLQAMFKPEIKKGAVPVVNMTDLLSDLLAIHNQ